MKDGKIYRKNLRQAKLDLSEFMLLCREAGYFDLREIAVAVFENNGKLSILPVAEKRPLTPQDVGLASEVTEIGIEVIMDGRILGENLTRMGRSEDWLYEKLSEKGLSSVKKVLLGIYRKEEGELTLYKNED